jgi:hypothetical protein
MQLGIYTGPYAKGYTRAYTKAYIQGEIYKAKKGKYYGIYTRGLGRYFGTTVVFLLVRTSVFWGVEIFAVFHKAFGLFPNCVLVFTYICVAYCVFCKVSVGARTGQDRPGEARRGNERPGEARSGHERP